jgi:F0F1-type ATP synthase delta subunit
MKYHPTHYATAFARAYARTAELHGRDAEKRGNELVKKFARVIEKNGDLRHFPKIITAIERGLHAGAGTKKITFVTARPSERIRAAFRHLIGTKDTVEEKVDPSIVGGVKVLVNDEIQFDGTLKRKIDKLFAN